MEIENHSNDRLVDPLDIASGNELRANEGRVRELQKKCRPHQLPRADGTYEFTDCEECGGEIGEGRLKVAIWNHLCVHCAEAQERSNKLRR